MNIDLKLLLKQKQALLRAIDLTRSNKDKALLYGVLHLLDHLHDTIDPPTITDF